VDDEKPIAEILEFNLQKEGYEVLIAHEGNEALDLILEEVPDLVLLDIMLPGKDGMEICREVRKKYDMPIIMLTAKDDEIDKVLGLELGADDYVTKPFSARELIARVKANLRRKTPSTEEDKTNENIIKIREISIDLDAYLVKKNDEEVELTQREFELLKYLAQYPGQVMTREHLLETVWGYDYFGDVRTVDVTVRRLREKIETDSSHPEYILTRRGVGYFIKGDDYMFKDLSRNLKSLQVKLVVIYVLLIIIGMQIIGLYFTNVLERDLTNNFKSNIESHIDLIESRIVELDSEYDTDRSKFQQA